MKEIKIPFSLDEYKKGEYSVQTRDGEDVRVICTNRISNTYPIVALVKYHNGEAMYSFSKNGKAFDSPYDLMLVKQEFEDGDIVVITDENDKYILSFHRYSTGSGCTILYNVLFNVNERFFVYDNIYCCNCKKIYIRLATDIEKQELNKALAKEGKRLNADNTDVIDIKYLFKPFDRVLVRDTYYEAWSIDLFSHYNDVKSYPYACARGKSFHMCIPYNEETKYLLNTEDNAPEKYKFW